MSECIKSKQFYGEYYSDLIIAKETTIEFVETIMTEQTSYMGNGLIEHYKCRIKSYDSLVTKMMKKQLDINLETAIENINDLIGIRIVCKFLADVYLIAEKFEQSDLFIVKNKKDYIAKAKPNGYRSYHLIVSVKVGEKHIPVEIQLRTISQDSWASLEHQMMYKKDCASKKVIQKELKRCADEMASTDISMETIRELIYDFSQE